MTSISEALAVASHHHQAGNLAEAERIYRHILALEPRHADALHFLGVIAHQVGKYDIAIDYIGKAIALNSGVAHFHKNIGEAYRATGKLEEAVAYYRQALALKPDYAEAHNNLGNALLDQDKFAEAIACYCQALALKPDLVEAHNNLGYALWEQVLLEEAVACCRQALALKPDYAEAHNNLGIALWDQGKHEEAIVCYRQALALKPDYPEAHNNLGIALLSAGDLSRGFTEYEWRWREKQFQRESARLILPQPFWDGSELHGRTILLYAEQGFGDTIQFIRYAPLVARRGGRVVVACQPELVRLLASVAGIAQVVSDREPLPDFDLYAPLLSLPRIIGTTLETIPSQCPYLKPPKSCALKLQKAPGTKLKIGIVWAGTVIRRFDRRPCPLSYFLRLAELPGIALYSLQKKPVPAGLGELTPTMPVLDLSDRLADFADTAAAITQLNLLITVDTAVAHLAGALNRPVWVLLPYEGAAWHWMRESETSPWYPSMRVFRQKAPGDWPGVFARAADALQTLVSAGLNF